MSKTLKDIKTALNDLGNSYEEAQYHEKEAVISRIYDEIASLGDPPLSDKNYSFFPGESEKKITVKNEEIYSCIVNLLFLKKKSFFLSFEQRKNKNIGFGDYLFLSAKNSLIRKYNENKKIISADQENADGEEWSLLEKDERSCASEESGYEEREQFIMFIMDYLKLMNHEGIFQGRMDNASHRDFIRLFYTERFSDICREASGNSHYHRVLKDNEALALNSIDGDFADHFEQRHCQCIEDFELVPYKQNKEFGIKQSPDDELKTPFRAKVYITFFESVRHDAVSDALITRKRKEFSKLVYLVCKKD